MRLLLLIALALTACASPTPTAAPATVTPFIIEATGLPATPTAGSVPAASSTTAAATPTPTEAAAQGVGYVTAEAASPSVLVAVERAGAEFDWPVQTGQGAEALTTLAQAGALVVVADGEALAAATRAAAEAFPNTYFIGVNQVDSGASLPNLLTLGGEPAREDQAGFMAGAIGGLLTEGRIVTAIGYPATPAGLKYRNGFLHGIRFTCSRCRVDFIDSLDQTDGVAVAERARLNASLSSDVVFAAAGAAGVQGLQAAAAQAAWIIGVDPADENGTFAPGAPGAEQWVTSVYLDPGAAVLNALRAFQAGTPLTGQQPLSAASGALVVAPYRVSEEVFSELDRRDLEALLARLADGSLETGIDPASGQER